MMEDIPVALEFRNQTWYSEAYREGTLAFHERREAGYTPLQTNHKQEKGQFH